MSDQHSGEKNKTELSVEILHSAMTPVGNLKRCIQVNEVNPATTPIN